MNLLKHVLSMSESGTLCGLRVLSLHVVMSVVVVSPLLILRGSAWCCQLLRSN